MMWKICVRTNHIDDKRIANKSACRMQHRENFKEERKLFLLEVK